MTESFELKIVASDKLFYEGKCEMLVFPAIDGTKGVLPHHESMVTALVSGELRFQVDGQWRYAAVSEGIVDIMQDSVILLADSVELPEEIDVKRAEEAKERAEERIRQKRSIQEFYHSQASLARAMARLKVTNKFR